MPPSGLCRADFLYKTWREGRIFPYNSRFDFFVRTACICRYGEPGAVVGRHGVTFQYEDIEPLVMQELISSKASSEDAEGEAGDFPIRIEPDADDESDGIHDLEEDVQPEVGVEPQVRSANGLEERLRGRRIIPPSLSLEATIVFVVPPGGTNSADFELRSEQPGESELK